MFKDKKVVHIVAVGKNGEIGKCNELLFRIIEDMDFFKKMTIGNSVLIGRKTLDTIPNRLKGRLVSLLSRDGWGDMWSNESILHAAMCKADNNADLLNTDSIIVVGGSTVYNQTFKYADELFITRVDAAKEADSFYIIPDGFERVGIISKAKMSKCGLMFNIEKWERKVV